MNVLYIVNMDPRNKTGLFNATHKRIKLNSRNINGEIYCINFYDGAIIKLFKKTLGMKVYEKENDSFSYEGIEYKNVFIKNTIVTKIMERIGLDVLTYLGVICKKRKRIQRFDIVSAHWGHTQGSLAFYIKKILGIPYTLTLHGSDIHTMPRQSKSIRRLILRNLNHSDKNIFVSNYLKNEAVKLGYYKENDAVIYNGIDRVQFQPLSLQKSKKYVRD
ncbi:glycosyltransferase [Bacillus sp. OVS6]|nr:glycosyltransferase [Bacillus sp. OVS6]